MKYLGYALIVILIAAFIGAIYPFVAVYFGMKDLMYVGPIAGGIAVGVLIRLMNKDDHKKQGAD